jgi:hypothetical protein
MNLNIHLVAILTTASITTSIAFFTSPSSAVAKKTTNPSAKSALIAAEFVCTQYKKRNGETGKQAADDAPSWVKNEGLKPCKSPTNEDRKTFATRVLNVKYGPGNYKTGAGSEHNQTQKYGDRSFE